MTATGTGMTSGTLPNTSQVDNTHVISEPCPARRDVVGTFHYLDGTCTPELLNASRSLASPNGYAELDDARRMTVHDVTRREGDFNLDTSGFCYVHHSSTVANDIITMTEEEIELKYYPETADLIKRLTGASTVHVFNHLRRVSYGNSPQALGGKDKVHHQAYKVHVDQSWRQVKAHIRHVFGSQDIEELMKQRFQIINIWRPLRTVFRDPLAVTDIRTQTPEDLVRIDVVLTDGIKTSNLAVRHNAGHRWYYKHAQRPDELLVFKQFDSADRTSLGQVLHSAFADEEYDLNEPRWSIEARALVFYDNQCGIHPKEVQDRGFGAEVKKKA